MSEGRKLDVLHPCSALEDSEAQNPARRDGIGPDLRQLWTTHGTRVRRDPGYAAATVVVLGGVFGAMPLIDVLAAVVALVFGVHMNGHHRPKPRRDPVEGRMGPRLNQRTEPSATPATTRPGHPAGGISHSAKEKAMTSTDCPADYQLRGPDQRRALPTRLSPPREPGRHRHRRHDGHRHRPRRPRPAERPPRCAMCSRRSSGAPPPESSRSFTRSRLSSHTGIGATGRASRTHRPRSDRRERSTKRGSAFGPQDPFVGRSTYHRTARTVLSRAGTLDVWGSG